jgi:hypothetical protein
MSPDDLVLNTPSVRHDDNRAQQNITFAAAPSPGVPASSSFWVNPQKMISDRSLELRFGSNGIVSTIDEVRLHVSPGLQVDRIVGGTVIGGYEGDEPWNPCELRPDELYSLICKPWKDDGGLARIIGGIDPNGRLLLEGIRVMGEPVRVTVEVVTSEKVEPGQRFQVDVVEFGRLENQESATEVGGMTLVFEHRIEKKL